MTLPFAAAGAIGVCEEGLNTNRLAHRQMPLQCEMKERCAASYYQIRAHGA
jgi:hypothetical protein